MAVGLWIVGLVCWCLGFAVVCAIGLCRKKKKGLPVLLRFTRKEDYLRLPLPLSLTSVHKEDAEHRDLQPFNLGRSFPKIGQPILLYGIRGVALGPDPTLLVAGFSSFTPSNTKVFNIYLYSLLRGHQASPATLALTLSLNHTPLIYISNYDTAITTLSISNNVPSVRIIDLLPTPRVIAQGRIFDLYPEDLGLTSSSWTSLFGASQAIPLFCIDDDTIHLIFIVEEASAVLDTKFQRCPRGWSLVRLNRHLLHTRMNRVTERFEREDGCTFTLVWKRPNGATEAMELDLSSGKWSRGCIDPPCKQEERTKKAWRVYHPCRHAAAFQVDENREVKFWSGSGRPLTLGYLAWSVVEKTCPDLDNLISDIRNDHLLPPAIIQEYRQHRAWTNREPLCINLGDTL